MEVLIFLVLYVAVIAVIKSLLRKKKNRKILTQSKPSGSFSEFARKEASLKSKPPKENASKPGYNKHGERTVISAEEFKSNFSGGKTNRRFHVTDSTVHCPDGETISISKIVSAKAPTTFIGTNPNGEWQITQSSGGAVVILYDKVGHWPKEKLIRTGSMQEAQEIVKQIQSARKTLKSPQKENKSGTARIEVGKCSKCGKSLCVRSHVIKHKMNLTCKCGHHNDVTVHDVLINNSSSPSDLTVNKDDGGTIDYSRCMICFACAPKSHCLKCGKNVFELDTDRVK